MLSVFIVVGSAGVVLLLLSAFLGSIAQGVDSCLDFLHVGISSAALAVAMAIFGAAGTIAWMSTDSAWLAAVIAVVAAAVMAVVSHRLISAADVDKGRANRSVVGLLGTVTSPVSVTVGEVRLDDRREVETYLARIGGQDEIDSLLGRPEQEPLAVGTRIIVRSQDEDGKLLVTSL